MIHKHRGNRRVIRLRKINRKLRLERSVMLTAAEWLDKKPKNKYNKGKVHCSCNLCAIKSTKLRRSKYSGSGHIHYNSEKWYAVNDRRKFNEMDNKLKEYYKNLSA